MISGIDTTFMVQFEVREHPGHIAARALFENHLRNNGTFALTMQNLTEFVHVITDPRRFEHPLTVQAASSRARTWWEAREIKQVFTNAHTAPLFFRWMSEHRLGRKRLLDTLLAATYLSNGIAVVTTSNAADFKVFDGIEIIDPAAL